MRQCSASISIGDFSKVLAKDSLYSNSSLIYEICDENWPEGAHVADKMFFNDFSTQVILNVLFILNPLIKFPLRRLALLFPLDYFAVGPDLSEWWYENKQEQLRFAKETSRTHLNLREVKSFFTRSNIPLPCELFKNDPVNTETVFKEITKDFNLDIITIYPTLKSIRSVMKKFRNTASTVTESPAEPVAVVQDAPVVEVQEKPANAIKTGNLAAMAATWEEIHIVFVNDYSIEIHCKGTIVNKTFDELKFSDGRKKEEPNTSWLLLKQFAEARGELSPAGNITKKISNLRKVLWSIFPHIQTDPVTYKSERQAYVTAFTTSSRIFRE